MITLHNVTAHYHSQCVLKEVSLRVASGERVAVVGPNGAGKSSLLRVLTGLLSAQGTIQLAGRDLHRLSARERAMLISVVPQEIVSDIPYKADDFVLLGRTAALSRLGGPSRDDLKAVQEAMRLTQTWELRKRLLPEMSGGERQRLALAMALASQPKILLLDEPTSHLDLRHRAEMMRLLFKLSAEQRITLLMVVHDLTLASHYFERILLLSGGRTVADGTVAEVMTPALLETAFNCPVRVDTLPGISAVCALARL